MIETVGGVVSPVLRPSALKAAMCITHAEPFWVAVALYAPAEVDELVRGAVAEVGPAGW